jgi:uncharacterized protein YcbK (DUF882 family)
VTPALRAPLGVAVGLGFAVGALAPVRSLAGPGPGPDRGPEATPAAPAPAVPAQLAKKDRLRLAKSTRHGPPPAPGTRPAQLVNLYNFWTREWLAVDATTRPASGTVDRFLRDHFTNKPAVMEPRLIDVLFAAAASFHSDVVDVVSGFRHPKYNLILRKKGHQVARDSQHTHGNAIDFYIPNVAPRALEAWARTQRLGGVGFYPESGFVHMDTGPIRYWSGE